jgi:hypothetical protein
MFLHDFIRFRTWSGTILCDLLEFNLYQKLSA